MRMMSVGRAAPILFGVARPARLFSAAKASHARPDSRCADGGLRLMRQVSVQRRFPIPRGGVVGLKQSKRDEASPMTTQALIGLPGSAAAPPRAAFPLAAAGGLAPQPWEALDALDEGLAVHDRPGRQVFANTALHRLAEAADGLQRAPGGAVLPTDPGALRLLQRALAAAAAGTAVELAVPRRSGAPPYLMRCSPVPGRSGWTVLRVADSAQRRCPSAVFLRAAFGLTQTEALLAVALCRGDSLAGHAAARGISIHTVRTQLRSLLGKTRTERQADLVGLLSGLAF
jgi:DNA-binding CsgD family transcriptional regulator